jgi:hypothetical protein
MLQNKQKIDELITDFQFYKDLLEASIYKPNIINLFERLQYLKSDIENIKKGALDLLKDVHLQINQTREKIECEDLDCDAFFIKNYELLQRKSEEFFTKAYNFKKQMFEYLRSVLNT